MGNLAKMVVKEAAEKRKGMDSMVSPSKPSDPIIESLTIRKAAKGGYLIECRGPGLYDSPPHIAKNDAELKKVVIDLLGEATEDEKTEKKSDEKE